jgi:CPA1 family monovalent cation:H+ antiporter
VAAGITLSYRDMWQWRAATRLRRTAVWDTVQLVANGSIFVLLGEQIPALISAAPRTVRTIAHEDPWWLGMYVLVIVVALAALRFAWVWASLKFSALGARRRGEPGPGANWRMVLVTSLAGVRGAVTLAGVLTLPVTMGHGVAFPARDLSILLAAGVIVLSLVLAAVALPRALRGLDFPAEPSNAGAQSRARIAAAEAAVSAIEATPLPAQPGTAGAQRHADVAAKLVVLYRRRIDRYGGGAAAMVRHGKEDDIERQLRLVGLRAERDEILRIGPRHGIGEVALHKIVHELDLQESRYGG